jgi:hypothetical protein
MSIVKVIFLSIYLITRVDPVAYDPHPLQLCGVLVAGPTSASQPRHHHSTLAMPRVNQLVAYKAAQGILFHTARRRR